MTEDVPCPPLLPPLVPPGEDAEDDDGHDHSDEEGEAETNRQEDPCLSLDLLAMFDEALTPDIVTVTILASLIEPFVLLFEQV